MTLLEELLILTADDIEFETLSTQMLIDLALEEEMFIATSALTELSLRDEQTAGVVAEKILNTGHGDRYLQAQALEKFFSASPHQGLNYIRQNLVKFDPYVRRTVEELIAENRTIFNTELRNLLHKLKDELEYILHTENIGRNMDSTYLPLVLNVETTSLELLDTLSQLRLKSDYANEALHS